MPTLLTIGAFARASRLSPKALRLYDELGLLRPVRTDPRTGYRYYGPEQLATARLVAWLRRLGMPLAEIRSVCALPPAAAAERVAAWWGEAEQAFRSRQELARVLVEHLSGRDPEMSDERHDTIDQHPTDDRTRLRLRYAAACDQGLVREQNLDSVWTCDGLAAVADGFGPDPRTSQAALDALVAAVAPACHCVPGSTVEDCCPTHPGALLEVLHTACEQAVHTIRATRPDTGTQPSEPTAQASGTTLTALAWSAGELALVHVGDSRAYLLRGGELLRLTDDDTLVQRMVDAGELTEAEARTHPRRTVLIRALHPGSTATPRITAQRPEPGDRYLLTTDGVHAVLDPATIHHVLAEGADPDTTAARLLELVHAAGAPDNATCVVADVLARE
jgi:protein phosphatase